MSGWLDEPEPPRKPECPHFALIGAIVGLHRHPVGHRFRCICGRVFRVAVNSEGKKVFR